MRKNEAAAIVILADSSDDQPSSQLSELEDNDDTFAFKKTA